MKQLGIILFIAIIALALWFFLIEPAMNTQSDTPEADPETTEEVDTNTEDTTENRVPIQLNNADFDFKLVEMITEGFNPLFELQIHHAALPYSIPISEVFNAQDLDTATFPVPEDAVFAIDCFFNGQGPQYYGQAAGNELKVFFRDFDPTVHDPETGEMDEFQLLATFTCFEDGLETEIANADNFFAPQKGAPLKVTNADFSLECELLSEAQGIPKHSLKAISTKINDPIPFMEANGCMEISKDQFEQKAIPEDVAFGFNTWFAGGGQFGYAQAVGNELKIFSKFVDEGVAEEEAGDYELRKTLEFYENVIYVHPVSED